MYFVRLLPKRLMMIGHNLYGIHSGFLLLLQLLVGTGVTAPQSRRTGATDRTRAPAVRSWAGERRRSSCFPTSCSVARPICARGEERAHEEKRQFSPTTIKRTRVYLYAFICAHALHSPTPSLGYAFVYSYWTRRNRSRAATRIVTSSRRRTRRVFTHVARTSFVRHVVYEPDSEEGVKNDYSMSYRGPPVLLSSGSRVSGGLQPHVI